MQTLAQFFKPEHRKNGEEYFRKDLVYLSIAADTQVQALVKAGTGARVRLSAQSIASPKIEARCSCPSFAKGVFCKHIWATLLAVQKKHPDFLETKNEIVAVETAEPPEILARKAKQADFKKAQSERLKERSRQQRLEKKQSKRAMKQAAPTYAPEVQAALDYFDQNGFPLKNDLTASAIQFAKKKLARIFHPDLGGSHEEIVDLNHHSEILLSVVDERPADQGID